ncbi:hypothetical protein CORC01_08512 [Colletotrichum orchidophilum]|uniref:NDT80 domain-containing protein n=1 Tax=Colletotrichum orchidophilum TaxID=1209926 RepID=A0A1G4B491_9PEZI|nr:uncharacterized protein CORC01_08512 [Colletotrichum orchidophilum]OHE96135.1 hypothetical protein CORC01_08512 [Colletotrichum orchidophilum]
MNSSARRQDAKAYNIPGKSDKKIWPLLPVCSDLWTEDQYRERFRFVAEELKRAVDESDELSKRARFIDYELWMVGSTQKKATPSILIKCKETDVGGLKSLFDRTAASRLSCRRDTKWLQLLKESPPSKPPFRLFFVASHDNPTTLAIGAGTAYIAVDAAPATMCGALVTNGELRATIGLTLEVNGEDRLLTVDHIFNDPYSLWDEYERERHWNMRIEAEREAGTDSSDYSTPITLWEYDDDESEIESVDSSNNDDSSTASEYLGWPLNSRPHSGDADIGDMSHNRLFSYADTVPISLSVSDPTWNEPASVPPLDWICLKPEVVDLGLRRCNYVVPPGAAPSDAFMIQMVASEPRQLVIPVYLASGILGTRSGRLISRPSYVGSSPGQDLCEVWTMFFDDSRGVVRGESGSIVVDQETPAACGHVIGRDLFGHARIVPLVNTINQIKERFGSRFGPPAVVKLPLQPTEGRPAPPRPVLPWEDLKEFGVLRYDDSAGGYTARIGIQANVRGFWEENDKWSIFLSGAFSCACSFTLTPYLPGQSLEFARADTGQTQNVQNFAISISACVAGKEDERIGLVQRLRGQESGPLGKVQLDPGQGSRVTAEGPGSMMEHTFERVLFTRNTPSTADQYFQLVIELWANVGEETTPSYVKVAAYKSAKLTVLNTQNPFQSGINFTQKKQLINTLRLIESQVLSSKGVLTDSNVA